MQVRLQALELEKLDAWRAKQKDLPTRPEALRRILGLFIQRSGLISEPTGPATEVVKQMDAAIEEHRGSRRK